MIPLAKPDIGKEEIDNVTRSLQEGKIAQGEVVSEFEKEFARYIGTKHAIAVSNGTAALCIALKALLGDAKGKKVITTPFSFIATANSVLYAGAKPRFVDIDENSFNIDAGKIKTGKEDAVLLPVHLYGQAAQMDEIMAIAKEKNIPVLEDACQAHGAEYGGKKAGSFGIGTFSFYPTKNMTTGEGGMITTDSDEINEFARLYRNHGMPVRYTHTRIGYNYRMTDINAGIGLAQLKKLDGYVKKRRANAKVLNEELAGVKGIQTPVEGKKCKHSYNQYTIKVEKGRDELKEFLKGKEIGNEVYYPKTITQQEIYKGYGTYPIAEKMTTKVLSLPVNPTLGEEQMKAVASAVKEWARKK